MESIKKLETVGFSVIDFFNANCVEIAVEELNRLKIIDGTRGIGKWYDNTNVGSDEVLVEWDGSWFVFHTNKLGVPDGWRLSPFGILEVFRFKGAHTQAFNWVVHNYTRYTEYDYIQVGKDYWNIFKLPDANGIDRVRFDKWDYTSVKRTIGAEPMKVLPFYNSFTTEPSYLKYEQPFCGAYNMFDPLAYEIKEGDWSDIKNLIKHIFGEYYDYGIKYLKRGIERPDLPAHVLLLVSNEEGTGKTTFLKFMKLLHGNNLIVANPELLENTHNDWIEGKIFLAFEETEEYDKKLMNRIKSYTTQDTLMLNPKGKKAYDSRIFVKMIFTSNNELSPLMIEARDTRHWPLKVPVLQGDKQVRILDKYKKQMPAFINHLLNEVEAIDYQNEPDRLGFVRPDSELLQTMKYHSEDIFFKEYKSAMQVICEENETVKRFIFRPTDLKAALFPRDRAKPAWYSHKLKEMGIQKIVDEEGKAVRQRRISNLPFSQGDGTHHQALGTWFYHDNPLYVKGVKTLDPSIQEMVDSLPDPEQTNEDKQHFF